MPILPQVRLLALLGLFMTAAAIAHPSHVSFAEVGWNDSGSALEVALRVIPEDLESVLSQREGRAIVLREDEATRAVIASWLRDSFVVRAAGEALPLELVGIELGYDQTWLFFTVTARREATLTLDNRVLFELSRRPGQVQLNQVQRLWAGADERLRFTRGGGEQVLWP